MPWEPVDEQADGGHWEPVDESEQPSTLNAVGRGLRQGASLGFSDELGGAVQAGLAKLRNFAPKLADAMGIESRYGDMDAGEVYRQARDDERRDDQAAQDAHGLAYGAGNVAGGLVPGLATGGAGLAGTVGLGAAAGLGTGDADLTKGEYGHAALETGLGAATAGVLHGAGAVAGKASNALAGVGRRVAQGGEDAAMSAARGELGGVVQVGNRLVENLDRLEPHMDPAQGMVQRDLEDAYLPGLRKKLIDANQAALPGQAERIQAAQQAYQDVMNGQGQPKPFAAVRSVAQMAASQAKRIALGYVGGEVGEAVGGDQGKHLGRVAGYMAAGGKGSPIARMGLAAMLKTPAVLGRFAGPLMQAYARGGDASLAAAHFVLQSDPAYRAQLKSATDGTQPSGTGGD